MIWFNLALIFVLGAAAGFFLVLTLVYRARMIAAQCTGHNALDDLAVTQSRELQWQRRCDERDRHLREMKSGTTTLQTELQVAQNSLNEQNVQLRDRDRRLVEQASYLDTCVADMRSTWEQRLDAANLRAAKLADRLNAAERQVLQAQHGHRHEHAGWVENRGVLLARIDELMGLIQTHHDKRGHECCHLNDGEMYAAAGLEPADPRLPPLGEFIPQCIAYWFDKQGLPQPSANCRPRMPTCLPPEFDRDTVEEIIALLSQSTLEVDERLRLAGLGFGVAGKDTSWCLMAVPACNFAAEVWHSEDSLDLASRFRAAIQRAADASPYLAEVHCDSQVH